MYVYFPVDVIPSPCLIIEAGGIVFFVGAGHGVFT